MARKAASLFTLAAFVLASTACMTTRTKTITAPSDLPGSRAKIVSLVKTSGEQVDFTPSGPGRVRGPVIVGTAAARLSVPVTIEGPFSAIQRRPNGSVYALTDGSGRVHSVQRVLREGELRWSILINDRTARPVSIPVLEVSRIRFRKVNTILTILAVAVPVAFGFAILAGVVYADNI